MKDLSVFNDGEYAVRLPQYEKATYTLIFHHQDGTLSGNVREDFFDAAKSFAATISASQGSPEVGVSAALFLARHYLELALKSVVFGLRRLEKRTRNTPIEKVIEPSGHPLLSLWNEIKNHFPPKIGGREWNALDVEFVDAFVTEFDVVDPTSERFRYGREKCIVRNNAETLMVDWIALGNSLDHVYAVLDSMHTLLVEHHGDNADWQAEMESW